jgi:hypothetical protein
MLLRIQAPAQFAHVSGAKLQIAGTRSALTNDSADLAREKSV